MKCILLAAGYATRLYPITKNYPKPLLKINSLLPGEYYNTRYCAARRVI